ncbi:MAG: GFA family protein [Pseudomonadota bacterium]
MTSIHLKGGCLCGAVRYAAETPSKLHYYCHCTDCRRYGGAAYHAAIVVSADHLSVTGSLATWAVTADSGRTVARHACPSCHGHLMTSPWPDPNRYSLKAGTFDDPTLFKPAFEIWTRSRVAWAGPAETLTGFAEGFEGDLPLFA